MAGAISMLPAEVTAFLNAETGVFLEPASLLTGTRERDTFLEPATIILLEPERETFLEPPIDVFFDDAEEFLVSVKAFLSDAESSLDPSLTSLTVRLRLLIASSLEVLEYEEKLW